MLLRPDIGLFGAATVVFGLTEAGIKALGTSSANVALPTLAVAFDASFQAVQWVVLAYLLAITVFLLDFVYALVDPRVKVGGGSKNA